MELTIDQPTTITNKGYYWKLPVYSLVNDNNNIGIVMGVMVDAFGYMMQRIQYNSIFINYHIEINGEKLQYSKENCNYNGFNFLGEYPR